MGHDVYLGPRTTLLTTRAKIRIGDYVMSGPNLTVISGDHRTDILDRPMMTLSDEDKLPENDQDVIIGDDVWMGSGVTILKGVHVSDHCVIAAGAVVTKDIEPEFSIWGGVPARCLGSRLKG
ncbi:acyltransferase [Collinsella sp. AF20-14LB]|uniref:acyltransferase n=1 Tax=Collinsella sp. AF20-14LB TaxID=2292221 RepID=UPI001314A52E|nr:acyltransferase [Collinsella sp. AF20-14LB]